MSKLFKLKEWLTLPEAARHLSGVFEEGVAEADVLRLALDGQLRLSVRFVNEVPAMAGTLGGAEYSEEVEALARATCEISGKPFDEKVFYTTSILLKEGGVDEEKIYFNTGKRTGLNEVWDLPMIGNERVEIENLYQVLTDGPVKIDGGHEYGVFVEGSDGSLFRLVSQDAVPVFAIPYDGVLVVRTVALREFEQAISSKPMSVIRDESLLSVIAALLTGWPSGKAPTGKDLERAAQSAGIKISDCTISKALKAARDIAPSLRA